MPFRHSILGELRLGDARHHQGMAVFVGQVESRDLIVRFDSAALLKISKSRATNADTEQGLAENRERVRTAAQFLLANGPWTEAVGCVEVLVTSLDL